MSRIVMHIRQALQQRIGSLERSLEHRDKRRSERIQKRDAAAHDLYAVRADPSCIQVYGEIPTPTTDGHALKTTQPSVDDAINDLLAQYGDSARELTASDWHLEARLPNGSRLVLPRHLFEDALPLHHISRSSS